MKKTSRVAGELAFIQQISRDSHSAQKNVTLGIGDDCAILRPPPDSEVLVTTDLTLENRHFRRNLHPPESVGHRCLARGLSDLAAMGAIPIAAFLSLALPAKMLAESAGREWINRFLQGLRALGELHRVPLAGGDTSESPGGNNNALILADIVLIGHAPKGHALRRSGASAGDALYVTGQLGGAAAELSSMFRRNRLASVKTTDDHPHLFPEPRLDVGEALLRRNLATACIDLSDGLSSDLAHLCRASKLRAEIEQAAIPIHPLARKSGPPAALQSALHGGEDYELLFSAPTSRPMPTSLAGVSITRIGTLKNRSSRSPMMTLLTPDGTHTELEPGGWEHFTKPSTTRSRRSR